ncbi:MAG TPA: sulfur oxidation c-type cytochrome SoxA [Methylomirabilota bacterium]|nr:sulfur oxidation c-type cytochrome SoxA [Methylomirabilota bacterium]
MKRTTWWTAAVAAGALLALVGLRAQAQQGDAVKEIERYREALAEGNPAELWEARGEELWKTKRGPRQVSLEGCDLGKGSGMVKGVYVTLPRYFADVDRVMDLETRLVHCIVTLQGFTAGEATRQVFGDGAKRSDVEAVVAYVAAESKGAVMDVPTGHPREREAYALGERIFFFRGGSHDFSCASCHSAPGKRIRLQDLPNLTDPKDAQRAYTSWPAYRVSQGELRTMQWRLFDCFRQQRFPALEFGSDASIALTMFLARNANGGVFNAPAIKR